MARTADPLNARRLETLLQIQRSRESRRREEASSAERSLEAALVREHAASEELRLFRELENRRVDEAYRSVAQTGVAQIHLDAIAELERTLVVRERELAEVRRQARDEVAESGERYRVTIAALSVEKRKTEIRSESVERQASLLRIAMAFAEEAEAEEHTTDARRAP